MGPSIPLTQSILKKYYPVEDDSFRDYLMQSAPGCKRILDAGCGNGTIFKYHLESVETIIGIDLRDDLARNRQVNCAACSTVEKLPFADQTLDLIFSRFVFEHLRSPQQAFNEIARTLRPGGKLLLLVPNVWHYFVIMGRIIPHPIQQRFAGLVGYKEEDTFRTYYRANSPHRLNRLARNAGLEQVVLKRHEACPWFLSFSPITLCPAIVYERLVNRFAFLAPLRSHIIALYQKPGMAAHRGKER